MMTGLSFAEVVAVGFAVWLLIATVVVGALYLGGQYARAKLPDENADRTEKES